MPDGMNMKPVESKPAFTAEERAHRLHALVIALYNMRPDYLNLRMSEDEAENVRCNLQSMALNESRALIASGDLR